MHTYCPQRYRALFALRNKGGVAAVAVLGEAFGASSALLKHEVAYVMGQMQHPASAAVLCKVLKVGQGDHTVAELSV
jgi:deoxyhypusine monooxygenase